jgi:thiol:disulfide interchange protein
MNAMNLSSKPILCLFLTVFLVAGLLSTGCERPQADMDAGTVEPAAWLTDYEEALKRAGEERKPVLINFTGSDWCPPCMALHREVFATAEFNRFAAENLILLEIDFPRAKQQPAEVIHQNHRLQQKYEIEGFPTIVLLSPQGEETRRGGYRRGGPRPFIRWVEG